MGYTTIFYGGIELDPPLNDEEVAYLREFAGSRRMDRKSGPYTTGEGDYGMDHSEDVIDGNKPPLGQPGLWCQWVPGDSDPSVIEWDGGEKFYEAEAWMRYILQHFINPDPVAKKRCPETFDFLQGHTANGFIECQGDDQEDRWAIDVTDGVVTTLPGRVVYGDKSNEGEE